MTEFAKIENLKISLTVGKDDLTLGEESKLAIDILQNMEGFKVNNKVIIRDEIGNVREISGAEYYTADKNMCITTPTPNIATDGETFKLYTQEPVKKIENDTYIVFKKESEPTNYCLFKYTPSTAGGSAPVVKMGGTRKRRARRKPSKTPKRYRRKKV